VRSCRAPANLLAIPSICSLFVPVCGKRGRGVNGAGCTNQHCHGPRLRATQFRPGKMTKENLKNS
jgi:hypothetical protein